MEVFDSPLLPLLYLCRVSYSPSPPQQGCDTRRKTKGCQICLSSWGTFYLPNLFINIYLCVFVFSVWDELRIHDGFLCYDTHVECTGATHSSSRPALFCISTPSWSLHVNICPPSHLRFRWQHALVLFPSPSPSPPNSPSYQKGGIERPSLYGYIEPGSGRCVFVLAWDHDAVLDSEYHPIPGSPMVSLQLFEWDQFLPVWIGAEGVHVTTHSHCRNAHLPQHLSTQVPVGIQERCSVNQQPFYTEGQPCGSDHRGSEQ